jgi:hypothetical protein
MASVMTTGGEVKCGHGPGKVTLGSGASKLQVNDKAVLLKNDVDAKKVSGCTTVTDTSKSLQQCGEASVATGTASKLTVGGAAVLLESLKGKTDGKPPGVLSASAGQSKLDAT